MSRTMILYTAAILAPAAAVAETGPQFALGIGGGSVGGSLEAQFKFDDRVRLRAAANILSFEEDATVDDIEYTGDLTFSGGGLFGDFHPFANSFFVSGGAYFGDKSIDLDAAPQQTVTIGDVAFTPEEYGRLEGEAKFEDVAPFVGLGFDTTFTTTGPWGVRAMIGAAFFGSADVTLDSVGGTLSSDPMLIAELQAEAEEIESDVEDFQVYPILTLGLNYRF